MGPHANVDVEASVRRLTEAGDPDGATTAALRGYGPEVMRFLCALQKSEVDASEVFSFFAEDTLEEHEELRLGVLAPHLGVHAGASRLVPLDAQEARGEGGARLVASHLAARAGGADPDADVPSHRDEDTPARASGFASPGGSRAPHAPRRSRPRVGRARACSPRDDASPEATKREAARLRKRFQLVKEKLKALAKSEGILPDLRVALLPRRRRERTTRRPRALSGPRRRRGRPRRSPSRSASVARSW